MKIKIEVMLKDAILDPQGNTIKKSLNNLGFKNVKNVRQGKLIEVNLNSNSIPINIVRELRKDLYMSSIEGGWRIVMIFDAEKLCTGTQASANALLKILEEPPEKSLFILVTSYQNQLLDKHLVVQDYFCYLHFS